MCWRMRSCLGYFRRRQCSGVGRVSEVSFYPSKTFTMNINAGNNEGNYKQGTARSLMSAVYIEE